MFLGVKPDNSANDFAPMSGYRCI
ncbi:hypothetical protein BBta_0067 [Bradyrhizobium sp. BTAi1]|nr:hypothetical protein BBta_0067 [Bradyrhizobium sp. BTAi1]